MYKIIVKTTFLILVSLILLIIYLSTFGFETSKFNSQIKKNIKNIDERLVLKLEKVYLKLDLRNFSIRLNTENPVIFIEDSSIDIDEINTIINIKNYLKNKEIINYIDIKTKENSLKRVGKFVNTYKFNLANFFLLNQIKKGNIILNLKVKLDENLENNVELDLDGKLINTDISIPSNHIIKKINLAFTFKNDNFNFKNISFFFNEIKFQSEDITITKNNKNYNVKGNILNKPKNINFKVINDTFFNDTKYYLIENDIILDSNTDFSFEINNKYKIKKLQISSEGNFDNFKLFYKNNNLLRYFPNYKDKINFKKNNFKITFNKNETKINLLNQYSLNDKYEKIDLKLLIKDNRILFDTIIDSKNAKILIPEIEYKKNENINSQIFLQGFFAKNKILKINTFSIKDKKNFIKVENLFLNNNYKINKFDKVTLDYINNNNKQNKLKLLNKKEEMIIKGKSFDGKEFINTLFESSNKKNFLDIFQKFDKKVILSIDKLYIDDISFLSNLQGDLVYKNKKTYKGNIFAKLNDNNDFSIDLNTTSNDNKITKILIDNPEPFIKRYKFIKGFKEGNLYFESINDNGFSKSNLRIYNFKVKEVPILAKLLTLASLQGIADILTGEGIRFDELDMKFKNNLNLMTIEELYGIGPAISILMEGYIDKNKLVSLRGTLVPATTLNKAISNIPLIGDLLVGKKVGEGVLE